MAQHIFRDGPHSLGPLSGNVDAHDDAARVLARAIAHRVIADLHWLIAQRPDALQVVEATTQRLRRPALGPAPVIPARRMARAELVPATDPRGARMAPGQRRLIDAAFARITRALREKEEETR